MQPPPQDGGIAALLAAGAPGGGQAPQAPIGMKNGGLVQHFYDGSTEEGVTPADERGLPYDSGSAEQLLYSPELTRLAEIQAMRTLVQQPVEVPTLESAMQSRLPEYERLLGDNKASSQAALLFELAGAGLNFAANRGPRGEILRGSPMARLAGALSNIPAAVQKRVMDIEDTQRKLRMLAIQAGEKDRDEIQNLNAKLMTEKRSIMNNAVTAAARERAANVRSGALPGTGSRTQWEMNTFLDQGLMDRFASGQTTPQENNRIASAITSYTEPRYEAILDPDSKLPTGKYRTLPGKRLPQHVLDAQRMRNSGVTPPAGTTLPRTPTPVEAAPTTEPVAVPAPLLSEGGREPTEAGTARPTDRSVDEPTYLSPEEAFAAPVSLWRDRAKIAGPAAAAFGLISAVPTLGDPFRDITLARSQAALLEKEVVGAFLKSQQNSVTEQAMLNRVLNIAPAAMKDPETYGTNLIALNTIINEVLAENRQKADASPGSIGSRLSPEQRTEARNKISLLERLQRSFDLPPSVYSREDILRLPPGTTEVLINGTRLREIPPN